MRCVLCVGSGHAVCGRYVPSAASVGARVPHRAASRLLPDQAVPSERGAGQRRGLREHAEARLAARAGPGARAAGRQVPAHRAQRRVRSQRRGGGAAARPLRRLLRARQAAHRHPRAARRRARAAAPQGRCPPTAPPPATDRGTLTPRLLQDGADAASSASGAADLPPAKRERRGPPAKDKRRVLKRL